MARLLVEIDEDLKKDLKVRLIREGMTLKDWVARMAAAYVTGERTVPANGRAAATSPAPRQVVRSSRHDDYLD